jgi:hypothetical protein
MADGNEKWGASKSPRSEVMAQGTLSLVKEKPRHPQIDENARGNSQTK